MEPVERRNGLVFTKLISFSPLYSGELVQIMMATANENLSAKFCNRVLKFFTKLFQLSKCQWDLLHPAFSTACCCCIV